MSEFYLGPYLQHLGAIWRHLGAILATSWLILEPILAQPMLLLVHLEPVFARLRRILAHLGTEIPHSWKTNGFNLIFQIEKQNTQIERLGAISGHLDPTWCHLGPILAPLGTDFDLTSLGSSQACFRASWTNLGASWNRNPNQMEKSIRNQWF